MKAVIYTNEELLTGFLKTVLERKGIEYEVISDKLELLRTPYKIFPVTVLQYDDGDVVLSFTQAMERLSN